MGGDHVIIMDDIAFIVQDSLFNEGGFDFLSGDGFQAGSGEFILVASGDAAAEFDSGGLVGGNGIDGELAQLFQTGEAMAAGANIDNTDRLTPDDADMSPADSHDVGFIGGILGYQQGAGVAEQFIKGTYVGKGVTLDFGHEKSR